MRRQKKVVIEVLMFKLALEITHHSLAKQLPTTITSVIHSTLDQGLKVLFDVFVCEQFWAELFA